VSDFSSTSLFSLSQI